MYTFNSVVDELGGKAQVTGGAIVVYHNGKHTEVGKVMPETGVFVMSPAGHALLEELTGAEPEAVEAEPEAVEAEPEAVEVAPAKSKAKTKAKATVEKADDPFSDIGADD
jgi:hypothetical protein